MRLAVFAALLVALSGQQPQPSPPVVSMQHVAGNPARCPVCKQPVELAPVILMITGPSDTIDGSTLSLPVMICPRDGVLFAVRP